MSKIHSFNKIDDNLLTREQINMTIKTMFSQNGTDKTEEMSL